MTKFCACSEFPNKPLPRSAVVDVGRPALRPPRDHQPPLFARALQVEVFPSGRLGELD